MPIYQYERVEETGGCPFCAKGFERLQSVRDDALSVCPACGAPVRRVPVLSAVLSRTASFDDRAKSAGFSKLRRLGKGEYEKEY